MAHLLVRSSLGIYRQLWSEFQAEALSASGLQKLG